jgi:flagellin
LNVEYEALLSEVDRISEATEFNTVPLLNGQGTVIDIQVGTRNNPSVDRITFDPTSTNVSATALGLSLTSVLDKNSAQSSLDFIDRSIKQVSSIRADFGAVQNRLQATSNNIGISIENLSAANSRIRDTDMAEETAELTKQNILMQAGISVLAQANNAGNGALELLKSIPG